MGHFSGDKTGAIFELISPQLKLIRTASHSDGNRRHAAFIVHP